MFKLLLLMTTGMSLRRWDNSGQLEREISIYSKLSREIGAIDIYSYGVKEEKYLDCKTLHIGIDKKSPFWNIKFKSSRKTSYSNYIWNIYNLFTKSKYFSSLQAIKTNQFRGSIFGVIIKKIYRIPLIVRMGWYHTHFKVPSWKRVYLEKWVFGSSDLIIVTNILAKNYICKEYNISNSKVKVISNSIDTDSFKPQISSTIYDIIYVGRLHLEKNIDLIISAVSKIEQPLNVLIIGTGDSSILERFRELKRHTIQCYNRVPNTEIAGLLNMTSIAGTRPTPSAVGISRCATHALNCRDNCERT